MAHPESWSCTVFGSCTRHSGTICIFVAALLLVDMAVSRGGGAIILLGVVLGFRRLFRVGPVRNAEEDEPLVIQRNQFNVTGMWQRVERITDSYAQAFGLGLIVFGTVLAAFGDEIAELVLPIAFICTG